MHQSKSLGSLATWSSRGRTSSKGHLLDAAVPAEQWPTSAEQYELLADCGRGVSAVVYQARCRTNGKIVAIKALNLEALASPLEDIMHEAQTMKAYQHDAILPLYCSFVTGQELWMVMPYMEGGSVAHIMRYKYPDGLQEPVIATIMRQVLEALAYLHKQGDIHRDVKAGNVLVDGDGRVKLGDFGVAATPEREDDWGRGKPRLTFVGTPCWMAPEVLEQVAGYNTSADIWSFGITMLEMVHGHAPFSKLPPMKVLLMTLQGPPPQLEASCGSRHFSRSMREVVARCLNKEPSKRPTAKELLEHRFFKQAKDAEFLKRTLLAGLPALPQRCNEIRLGKAATLARENDRAAVASHISYMNDVAQWDFNCLKGLEGGLGPDGRAGSTGRQRDQQPQQQPGAAAAVLPASAADDVAMAAAKRSDQHQQYTKLPADGVAAVRSDSSTSPDAAAAAVQQPLFLNDVAHEPLQAAAAAAADAVQPKVGSPRLAYCFSGGKQVAIFPLSVPGTPEDHSPTSSRPTTPASYASTVAAATAGVPASAGGGIGVQPINTADVGSRPSTSGSGGMAAKRHGRFMIIEGSQPYQGPEIESGNSGLLPAPLSPLARQRSVSTPDVKQLAVLQLDKAALVLPAAAVTAQPAAAPSVTAALHDVSGNAAASTTHAGRVSRFLADKFKERQAQSPQKELSKHLFTKSRDQSPFAATAGSIFDTPVAAGGSSAALSPPPLARPGASLSEIYPQSPSPAAVAQPRVHSSPPVQRHEQQQQLPSLSRPAATLNEVYPAYQQQQHTASQLWDHVKEVCSEAVAHVAQPFRSHHQHHSPRRQSPEPRQQQCSVLPPQQQQQQQPALQHKDSRESLVSLISRDSGSGSYVSALGGLSPAGSGGSSGSSKPPRYQLGPGVVRQQQQQQHNGAASPSNALLQPAHKKSVSFAGLPDDDVKKAAAAAGAAPATTVSQQLVTSPPGQEAAASTRQGTQNVQQQQQDAASVGPLQSAQRSIVTEAHVMSERDIPRDEALLMDQFAGTCNALAAAAVAAQAAESAAAVSTTEPQPAAMNTSADAAVTADVHGGTHLQQQQQHGGEHHHHHEQQQQEPELALHQAALHETAVQHTTSSPAAPPATAPAAGADGTHVSRKQRGRFIVTET